MTTHTIPDGPPPVQSNDLLALVARINDQLAHIADGLDALVTLASARRDAGHTETETEHDALARRAHDALRRFTALDQRVVARSGWGISQEEQQRWRDAETAAIDAESALIAFERAHPDLPSRYRYAMDVGLMPYAGGVS